MEFVPHVCSISLSFLYSNTTKPTGRNGGIRRVLPFYVVELRSKEWRVERERVTTHTFKRVSLILSPCVLERKLFGTLYTQVVIRLLESYSDDPATMHKLKGSTAVVLPSPSPLSN
jgi:hypothetical protein